MSASPTHLWDETLHVITPGADVRSPMWQKMWERAGVPPSAVRWTALEQIQPGWVPPPGTAGLLLLGEQALREVAYETNLFRWRGRTLRTYRTGLPMTMVATMRVTDLLPRVQTGTVPLADQLANRPARFQGVWVRDVQHAMATVGVVHSRTHDYLLNPGPGLWQDWVRGALQGDTPLSFDIETQYTPVGLRSELEEEPEVAEGALLRIAFAHTPYAAVSVPWQQEYLEGIRALLTSPRAKLGWNCVAFDVPRLLAEGIEVGGRIYDMQDGWHLLQSDLPKGLEWVSSFYTDFAPWKHLSDQALDRYAAIDVDAALQNGQGIEADLRKRGQWDVFERHIVDLMPILARAGRRGNRIDLDYQTALVADMQAEKGRLTAEAQTHVPRALKPRTTQSTMPEAGVEHDVVMVPAMVKQCSVCQTVITNKSAHLKGGKKNPCHGAEIQLVPGEKPTYAVVEPFNLGSSTQLAVYAKAHTHPVGVNPKTKQPTMDKTQLEKLAKSVGAAHPVYQLALDYSRVAKTLSTYVYVPDAEGLIHTQYVNAPSTGRLASRNYNLQNVGKRETNPWAKKARRQIVARDGHIFVQADSTSIEAVVTGYLIGDPTFVEVAKQSIHAYLACKELGWAFTPETIEQVKREHKALYNQFKTAVYLLLYGGDPYLMHMTNPDLFPTKRSAQDIQQKIFALMPALPAWQTRVREQAKREGVLQSPWGYRHHFYDVYTFKRDAQGSIQLDEAGAPQIKLGQDAKRALAFIPQNCAGAFCRDSLLRIGTSRWGTAMPANVSVHDGYCLEVPEAEADAAEAFLIEVLTRPVPELGGLRIPCETDRGYNWADWSPDNPRGMRPGRKILV
ncbi:MAG: hypothetical protein EBS05_25135 [Proteobacteria bacterium]|nr:hypothetical protein [Pseudomonadota bacterium]